MDKKEFDFSKLDPENIEGVSGGDKITYEEAWNTLPHTNEGPGCPHCGCVSFQWMDTGEFAGHRFDLLRCRKCCQRYVLEK